MQISVSNVEQSVAAVKDIPIPPVSHISECHQFVTTSIGRIQARSLSCSECFPQECQHFDSHLTLFDPPSRLVSLKQFFDSK
jgi:hypothetical protein